MHRDESRRCRRSGGGARSNGGGDFDRHTEGVASALFGGDQHAANLPGCGRLVAELHGELGHRVLMDQRLRGGVLDDAIIVRVELERFHPASPAPQSLPSVSTSRPSAIWPRSAPARCPAARREPRQTRAGRPDRGSAARPNRQSKMQVGALRDTDIRAYQPAGLRSEIERRPILEIGSRRDLDQVHGVLRVAIIHQRGDLEAMRHGPDDVARGQARRAGSTPAGWPDRSRRDCANRCASRRECSARGPPRPIARVRWRRFADQSRLDVVGRDRITRQRTNGGDIARQAISQQPAKRSVVERHFSVRMTHVTQ